MNKMKSILSMHKILTICLAVFILATLTFASFNNKTSDGVDSPALKKAEALTGKAMNCLWYQRTVYYNDAAHTTQIGWIVFFCDGETGHSGTTSQFFTITTCECIEE